MKYYAIRTIDDKVVNLLYTDWNKCKEKVQGHNCQYKSFKTENEAKEYLNNNIKEITEKEALNSDKLVYYVDGSYIDNSIGWAYITVNDNEIISFANGFIEENDNTSRNISGELKASVQAMINATSVGEDEIYIIHDYQGISSFINGSWIPKTYEAKEYKKAVDDILKKSGLKVNFVKIKGHSNNKFNDKVDELAKKGAKRNKKKLDYKIVGIDFHRDKCDNGEIAEELRNEGFECVEELSYLGSEICMTVKIDRNCDSAILMTIDGVDVSDKNINLL